MRKASRHFSHAVCHMYIYHFSIPTSSRFLVISYLEGGILFCAALRQIRLTGSTVIPVDDMPY